MNTADKLRQEADRMGTSYASTVAHEAAALLEAIDALHYPLGTRVYKWAGAMRSQVVCSCGTYDCPTARLLNPGAS